jgi:hypothetical protein
MTAFLNRFLSLMAAPPLICVMKEGIAFGRQGFFSLIDWSLLSYKSIAQDEKKNKHMFDNAPLVLSGYHVS